MIPRERVIDAIRIEARRDVAAGEEPTIDYALFIASDWEMVCDCGTKPCRKVIRGSDWCRPELQARYAGHFAPFLSQRIARRRAGVAP